MKLFHFFRKKLKAVLYYIKYLIGYCIVLLSTKKEKNIGIIIHVETDITIFGDGFEYQYRPLTKIKKDYLHNEAMATVCTHEDEWKNKYPGKIVAVYKNKIIGIAPKGFLGTLAGEIYNVFGYVPFYCCDCFDEDPMVMPSSMEIFGGEEILSKK